MTEDKARIAAAQRKARMLALPRPKRCGVDSSRGGRLGDDYDADDNLLKLDSYNKRRLMLRLDALVNEHRWVEAAGAVSTLLRSLSWWSKPDANNRTIFTVAMEVLRQVEPGQDNRNRFRKLFNLMYNHQPSNKTLEAKRLRGEVQLELALYLTNLRDYEGAYNVLRPIVDAPPLRDDAAVNFSYGLVLHRLWYEIVSEQTSEDASEGSFSGEWQPEGGDDETGNKKAAVDNIVVPISGRETAEPTENEDNSNSPEISMDNTVKFDAFSIQSRKRMKRSHYVEDDEFWQNATIYVQPDMDRRLFPVRIPYEGPNIEYVVPLTSRAKELYDAAVKHLQQALASAPELTSALLLLVQLLLAAGDVEAANKEIGICYQATKHIVPLSLKALLLESFAEKDVGRLAHCYEEILQHNPSSIDAMSGLIGLHDNGEYETEALVQAIAVHLDAEPGSIHVWHKLADCFLEIASYLKSIEEDRGATCEISPEEVVDTFLDRSGWWTNKHFPALQSVDKDNLKLIAHKAACAAHIYGPELDYVRGVSSLLGLQKKKRLSAALRLHCQQSLCLLDCVPAGPITCG